MIMAQDETQTPLQNCGDFLFKRVSLFGYDNVELQECHTQHGTQTVGFYDKNGVKRLFLSKNTIADIERQDDKSDVAIIDLDRVERRLNSKKTKDILL